MLRAYYSSRPTEDYVRPTVHEYITSAVAASKNFLLRSSLYERSRLGSSSSPVAYRNSDPFGAWLDLLPTFQKLKLSISKARHPASVRCFSLAHRGEAKARRPPRTLHTYSHPLHSIPPHSLHLVTRHLERTTEHDARREAWVCHHA
jgi:hypothetical protein